MQSVSSRIWTHVVVSISYDYNHYTTSTSYLFDSILFYYNYDIPCEFFTPALTDGLSREYE